jgi:ketosteroid isomerase-like protein
MGFISFGYAGILATSFLLWVNLSNQANAKKSVVTKESIEVHASLNNNEQSELYNEILKQDSILFTAFNTCDIKTFRAKFTDDLEFYHDKGGLTGIDHTMNFMNETCNNTERKLRRGLIKEGMEVYPIKDYGAVQIASHSFYITEKGKQEVKSGTFKFVHVWKKTNEGWKISRVVSYDH